MSNIPKTNFGIPELIISIFIVAIMAIVIWPAYRAYVTGDRITCIDLHDNVYNEVGELRTSTNGGYEVWRNGLLMQTIPSGSQCSAVAPEYGK